MAWIKRNLFFAIGSIVALALMGCGIWYLLSNMGVNKGTQQKLDEAYNQLDTLSQQGTGDIAGVTNQTQQLREVIEKFRNQFKSIPPIPNKDVNQISSQDFISVLPVTIAELERSAALASVTLPPQFGFSFEAERALTRLAPGSAGPLAVQLGEVKAICDVLYAVKINSLDSIRRERVSPDDEVGSPTYYLEKKSTTTETATLTPYEISFRCFGADLSALLTKFASSPYCFVVETLRVEPGEGYTTGGGGYGGYGGYGNPEVPATRGYQMTPATTPTAGATKGGLTTYLDEKPIRVTLGLEIVKLNSKR